MPDSPEHRPTSTHRGHRRGLSGAASVCDIVSASLLGAACCDGAGAQRSPAREARCCRRISSRRAISQPVSQEGTVVAVSADSVTMRGADGHIQTYRFTPDTTVVTRGARQPITAAPHFTVNDKVVVVGTIEGSNGAGDRGGLPGRRAWRGSRRWITLTAKRFHPAPPELQLRNSRFLAATCVDRMSLAAGCCSA